MAGLYIHIPFCKSRCIYCGFYSTTLHSLRARYVDALCREMELRSISGNPLDSRVSISTIYLGGGTPSQLNAHELNQIFDSIYRFYQVEDSAEITMECNPDDLAPNTQTHPFSNAFSDSKNPSYVEILSQLPINRISLGIQTFSDNLLQFLHRRHTASQAKEAIRLLRAVGFKNISIDLMFGFPDETIDEWQYDIDQALQLDVEHISAYSLMYEEATPLFEMRAKSISEDLSLAMYHLLIDRLTAAGYEHYEISNFAKTTHSVSAPLSSRLVKVEKSSPTYYSYRSRHNSSYWHGVPYIGIGAAAHSFDIDSRYWNVSDVRQYIQSIENGELPVDEKEILSVSEKYDDMVMTALRTKEGINLEQVLNRFGTDYHDYLLKNASPYLNSQMLTLNDTNQLRLTQKGLYISDSIMSDLMYV